MNAIRSAVLAVGVFAVLFFTVSSASAQQKTPATLRRPSNVVANDTVLEGTVVSFTANSTVAPLGAHVVVQTSSGSVDVHLGKMALLKESGISLVAGDAVRIAGSSISYGDSTIF